METLLARKYVWDNDKSSVEGGLLLDLREGSLTYYKNGMPAYDIQEDGLSGDYVWVVSMFCDANAFVVRTLSDTEDNKDHLEMFFEAKTFSYTAPGANVEGTNNC